ncbi:uncharacterized protein LOC117301249 [Asterias rubens]|uniref:uncharacterized protein LOC117301249 n=1 Tax=Asterias rubens TaxID=7604 RepID=UPI0014552DBA|nr:uncharacterized protein LOC117301249 [Asterias rubens]
MSALPCQVYTTNDNIRFKKEVMIPAHFEFDVVSNNEVALKFSVSGRFFEVELTSSQSVIEEEIDGVENSFRSYISLVATRVVLAISNTEITVGEKGNPGSQFSFAYPAISTTGSLTVLLEGDGDATWSFYNNCEVPFVQK